MNLHAAIAYAALGTLAFGLAIQLSNRVIGRRAIRLAGRRLVVIGALMNVPAAITGIYAAYDVVRSAGDDVIAAGAQPWYRLVRDATPRLSRERWDGLEQHAWRMAGGTAVVLFSAVLFLGDRGERRWRLAALSLLALATGFMTWEGWRAHPRTPASRDAIDPLQVHLALGGIAVAAALAALVSSAQPIATAAAPPARAVRLGVFAAIIAIVTAAIGAWVAGLFGNWERTKAALAQPRDLVHAALGASIIVLTIILAILTRRAPRRRWMIRATGALLLAALTLEIATGTLLLYDGSDRGASIWRFRQPTVQTPTNLDAD